MAKIVIWSSRAQKDKRDILQYWVQRNKSNEYSKKLKQLFKDAIKLIVEYPQIGSLTDSPAVRIKIVKEYLLIYELSENSIFILSIWDGRQDPIKLEGILK